MKRVRYDVATLDGEPIKKGIPIRELAGVLDYQPKSMNYITTQMEDDEPTVIRNFLVTRHTLNDISEKTNLTSVEYVTWFALEWEKACKPLRKLYKKNGDE